MISHKTGRLRRRMTAVTVCLVALSTVLYGVLEVRVRPVLREYAAVQAATISGLAVNRAVGELVCRTQGDFLSFFYDESGCVQSVSVNEQALNTFKAQVAQASITALSGSDCLPVSIPLGSVVGGSLFTGRGPLLQFPVHTAASAVVELQTAFSGAGINQTRHTVTVTVDIEMAITLPDGILHRTYRQTCMVSQTVLMGKIPQVYIGQSDNAALCRVLGYAQ